MAGLQVTERFGSEGEVSEWEGSERELSEAGGSEGMEKVKDGSEVSEEAEYEYESMLMLATGYGSESADEEERTFEYFPKLPMELRLKIWKEAMPGPRYVMLLSTKDDQDWHRECAQNNSAWFPVCIDYVPDLFFVCKESRTEVVKLYKPLKGTAMSGAVWIDVQKDVLCAVDGRCHKDFGTVLNEMPTEITAGLSRIAIDVYLLVSTWDDISDDLLKLPALAEFSIGYFHRYERSSIIGGFAVEEDLDKIAKEVRRISKYTGFNFKGLKDNNPEWKAPSIKVGRFIPEFIDGDESEAEEEDDQEDKENDGPEEYVGDDSDIPDDSPDSGPDDDSDEDSNDTRILGPPSVPIYYYG